MSISKKIMNSLLLLLLLCCLSFGNKENPSKAIEKGHQVSLIFGFQDVFSPEYIGIWSTFYSTKSKKLNFSLNTDFEMIRIKNYGYNSMLLNVNPTLFMNISKFIKPEIGIGLTLGGKKTNTYYCPFYSTNSDYEYIIKNSEGEIYEYLYLASKNGSWGFNVQTALTFIYKSLALKSALRYLYLFDYYKYEMEFQESNNDAYHKSEGFSKQQIFYNTSSIWISLKKIYLILGIRVGKSYPEYELPNTNIFAWYTSWPKWSHHILKFDKMGFIGIAYNF